MQELHTVPMELQFFAEGAGGAAGAGGEGGEGGAPGAAPAATAQPERGKYRNVTRHEPAANKASIPVMPAEAAPAAKEQEAAPNPEAEFDALVGKDGKYREFFQKRTDSIINRRFAETKALQEQQAAVTPLLAKIATRYGVDPTDLKAIDKALDEDRTEITALADKLGVTEEVAEEIQKGKRMTAALEAEKKIRAEQERNLLKQRQIEAIHEQWRQQSAEMQGIYPDFNFDKEYANPEFQRLLAAQVPVRAAFEVIHRDEIMGGLVHHTAQKTREAVAQDIQARGNRPPENGTTGTVATVQGFDYARLSKAARQEIEQRAMRGEKIGPKELQSYMNR